MLSVAGYRPDGRVLTVLLDRGFADQTILLLEVIGGGHREVPRDRPTQYQAVRWTPDGTLMALTDAGGRDFLALCRIDPQTGAATPVYEAPGRDVEAWALSPDRALLATVENDRGYAVLRVGPVDGDRPAIGGLPRGVAAELSFAADSSRLAFSASSPTEPPGLWVWEAATGTARPVWRPDPYQEAGIPPERFRDFALVEWPSLDERPIPGWLAFPEGERPERGWPAVIWVHGGPAAQTRANFRPDMQMLLAQGYAVLMPNVRGSTGYGRAATESDDRERRHDALQDLVHGWQWLAAHPDIDKRRIGLMGQSYGGWMVLAAITEHPGLWRAAVEYYGIADFTTLLTTTGPWRRDHRAREYGDPARDVELFRRISPIHHVKRVVAPLLVLHGRRDPRVPITESEAFVGAMRDRGQFVKYEVFDYAGHGFIRADDRRRAWHEVAAFFAAHMG
jgi:dipeptidyl aminopeptidase/acylaminoacyl peptidase